MKTYWDNLNDRERWMLGVGVVSCFFYLFYLLFYAPLVNAVKERTQQVAEKKETLVWMQQVRRQYKVSKAPNTLSHTELLTLLAKQLNHPSFQQFPYQLQQTGAEDIQLSFERVPFNVFLNWLWSLNKRYAILIKQFNVERSDTQGVVKLQVVIAAKV
ncbi:type II secretion system protein GspM [Legionella oakridgensis]|uniref:Type II secretory pathway, component PulM n=2 Tax=Legionella oakridgensis TaxID=29423 RepID=W0BCZ7_9GAMM|nr:type II secretion system protein GspM [Legionella oakridgensis]AHE66507.1 type II secretory pathway, component PulM [Legionella oakridgensis ATCC 33761 = DSM 21215]ETO93773.1 type II secretory pathway, component PulM [Legionella oakridgensis RV-2-2007]KTD43926.1 putative general secretion pathway protein YghD [Legionella oakridgensis]STY19669.1 general secretion pathway protein M [Legionella longbeachae]